MTGSRRGNAWGNGSREEVDEEEEEEEEEEDGFVEGSLSTGCEGVGAL